MTINEFPYDGRVERDGVRVWEGSCDVQLITPEIGSVLHDANYSVHLPMPIINGVPTNPIRKNDLFYCVVYGDAFVECRVINATASMLGYLTLYIDRQIW